MKGNLLLRPLVSPHLKPLFLSSILIATPGLAAAQFKCVDKAGKITLTDLACPGRNVRGPKVEKPASDAAAMEDMHKAAGVSNDSAAIPRGNVPAKQLPLDAVEEKPPARKKTPAA